MTTATRFTDPTLPLTVLDPIRDDNVYRLWLVPGDWTRGRALAHVAREEGVPFTTLRARRTYLRWGHLVSGVVGWQFNDGTLMPCDRKDSDAERYWTVTNR